jgi:polar amino acid transport system substrate-binding protein
MNQNYYYIPLSLLLFVVSSFGLYKYWKKDPDSIVVGVSTDYPPFCSKVQNNLVGFDIDLARIVVDKLGKKIVFKEMNFTSLVISLVSGRIDMIAAGISPTEARASKVDFSSPYYYDSISVVVKNNEFKLLSELKDEYVGVQTGSLAETLAREWTVEDGFKLVALDQNTQIIQALKSNRIKGLIIASAEAAEIVKECSDSKLTSFVVTEKNYSNEGVALALQKNSPLTETVNLIISELHKSGELQKLKIKYNLNTKHLEEEAEEEQDEVEETDQSEDEEEIEVETETEDIDE